jgi:hypothetical protein
MPGPGRGGHGHRERHHAAPRATPGRGRTRSRYIAASRQAAPLPRQASGSMPRRRSRRRARRQTLRAASGPASSPSGDGSRQSSACTPARPPCRSAPGGRHPPRGVRVRPTRPPACRPDGPGSTMAGRSSPDTSSGADRPLRGAPTVRGPRSRGTAGRRSWRRRRCRPCRRGAATPGRGRPVAVSGGRQHFGARTLRERAPRMSRRSPSVSCVQSARTFDVAPYHAA